MGTLIGVHTIVPGMRVLCQLENCSVIVRVSPPAVASKIGLFWMWNWLKNGVSIPSQAVLVKGSLVEKLPSYGDLKLQ